MSARQVTPRWNDGTRLAVRNVLQQFLDAEEQKVGFLRSLLEVEAGVADAAAAAARTRAAAAVTAAYGDGDGGASADGDATSSTAEGCVVSHFGASAAVPF